MGRLRSTTALVALTLLGALGAASQPAPAAADVTDGTLTVIVVRDVDANGSYDKDTDTPQAGIEITVTDAGGEAVEGVTDRDGQYELKATDDLKGGRYFVVAEIPGSLDDLTPVAESDSFAALSTAVDVTSEDQVVRMGVALAGEPEPEKSPGPEPTVPATDERTTAPRFAVGDLVFRDVNRSGVHDPNEPATAGISVQLLDSDGDVLDSTITSSTGHYSFDNLEAGTYSVRFAGIPEGARLAPNGSGSDPAIDSNPDYTGATPPFTLGVNERNVRDVTSADHVDAAYINPTIDAGITSLQFAVMDQVWLDVNGDGVQQVTEPGVGATVSLLSADGEVLATTRATDAEGKYAFTDLGPGRYRVRVDDLPGNRAFTVRSAGSDRTMDSDVDPATGLTPVFSLSQGAPNLVPAAEIGVAGVDYVNQTISAGLVGSYSIGDTVWHDVDGDGVLEPGDEGMAGVTVQLLSIDGPVIKSMVTSGTGRFTFSGLPAGSYQVKFTDLPDGLRFTAPGLGGNPAVDSNVGADGVTAMVTVGDDNPADTTIDAGVTSPGSYAAAAAAPGDAGPSVDTALSNTGGVEPVIPISGLIMLLSGLGCLLVERRRARSGSRPLG
jgi:uncharacterized protein (DUF2141 family)